MNKKIIIFPKHQKLLEEMGENIKLARLRRKITEDQICERADINKKTLEQIENGSPLIELGYYLKVLIPLGLEQTLFDIAKNDITGRKIQDIDLLLNH